MGVWRYRGDRDRFIGSRTNEIFESWTAARPVAAKNADALLDIAASEAETEADTKEIQYAAEQFEKARA